MRRIPSACPTVMLILAALLASCDDVEQPSPGLPSLVVEGWIEDGGFPVVILTTTLPVSSDYTNINNLGDHLLRWAKVTVSDGQDSVVLTGKYDSGYFPPYIYTTGRMRGKAGRCYTLTADYRQWHATATTTIPSPPAVDGYRVERAAGSDTLYRITARLNDNAEEKNYYQIFTKTGSASKQYAASYLGCIDDAVLDGPADIPVYRPHLMTGGKYTPYFSVNDTVYVKFAQIDRASFRFWNEYIKSQSLANNMFLYTSSNLPSNITGGLGYWCGYGSAEGMFIIRNYAGE